MAIFSPDVTEDELPAAIERVGGYITTAGGEIASVNHESPWGRRRLAYAIRYQGRDVRDGFYVLYYFDVQSTQIAEIEREIRLNDKLIRHIITIRGEIPTSPEPEESAEGEPVAAQTADASEAPAVPDSESAAPTPESAQDRSEPSGAEQAPSEAAATEQMPPEPAEVATDGAPAAEVVESGADAPAEPAAEEAVPVSAASQTEPTES